MIIKRIGSLIKKFINIYRAEGFAHALKRGAKNLEKLFPAIAFRRYRRWYEQHEPSLQELEQQRQHAQEMAQPPLISLAIPVFNPPPRDPQRNHGFSPQPDLPELGMLPGEW
jgi:hypothetical protein